MLHTPLPRHSGGRSRRCRRLTGGFIAVLLIPVLGLAAHRAVAVDGWLREVVVAGPSMSPTLWGPSYRSQCPSCSAEIRFHSLTAPRRLRCWNCGTQQNSASFQAVAADRVYLDRAAYDWRLLGIPLRQNAPVRGDLVAIEQSGVLRVKRILAVPGDRLSLEGNSLRINEQPVNEVLLRDVPAVVVHTAFILQPDQLAGPPSLEQRWQWRDQWLIYHHYSVHDQRADRIRDDYAGNIDVSRRLNAVDAIGVAVQLELQQDSTIEVVCWQSDQPVVYRRTFPAGEHHWEIPWRGRAPCTGVSDATEGWKVSPTCDDTLVDSALIDSELVDSALVDAFRPIAIAGLQAAENSPIALTVLREVHWFVDADQRAAWSLRGGSHTLAAGRYFVGGDNQPLSIDSRAVPAGIRVHQIIGQVIPR